MKNIFKEFGHGLSLGIFKTKNKLLGSWRSIADSTEMSLEKVEEHYDDILEDMEQDLDDLVNEGKWIMRLLGLILLLAVVAFGIVEFIYQLGEMSVLDAPTRTVVVAAVSTLLAVLTIPFGYLTMKPGRPLSRIFSLLVFVFLAGFGMYNMSSTAGQTNSSRLGAQKYQAQTAKSNASRLDVKREKLLKLENAGVSAEGREKLAQNIRDVLASKDRRGRRLAQLTENCHATRISGRRNRKACRQVRVWETRLKQKDKIILLKSDISELEKRVSEGDKGQHEDAGSVVVAEFLKTDKGTVQLYSNFILMLVLGTVIFSAELVYWDQVFDKGTNQKILQRGIRHKKNALVRQQLSPVMQGASASPGLAMQQGSLHAHVSQFLASNLFEIQADGELSIPDLHRLYGLWSATQGFPPVLIVDFRDAVHELFRTSALKPGLSLSQSVHGVAIVQGLLQVRQVAA